MSEADLAVAESLSKALSPESARALAKFSEILVKADELGLLDTLKDLLDGEVLGDVAKSLLNTGVVALLMNLDKISAVLESLAKNADALAKALSLLEGLERSGLLNAAASLAEPEVLGEAAQAYLTTGAFYLVNEAPKILDGLASVRVAHALDSALAESRRAQAPSFLETLNTLMLDEDARRGLYFLASLLKNIGASLRPR
ncbi:hypothetical protein TUZN_0285 [Thermoproteus uzoniensis 768-20]|uniref:DUF1641 domain-containing protein n=1 Tax=Thermoproteus uzoniensis (strain 768-20) TaxID=999630 RepID=F2L2B8_THEU7|nr:hypothetical protein [Thermoproteus uzoniensis]AEA11783.1 hypothetical protein TUZN_0285 [Thermoproteus uzoniensis 768-20]